MINEISLRTDKGEYSPGEDIKGVVYLRIIRPTGGTGIQVKVRGYEKFSYEYKNEFDAGGILVGYSDHRDYINHNVELFKTQDGEPLNMGNHLYPFKIHLPSEMPGTMLASGEDDEVQWHITVEYILHVQVICQPQLNTVLPIVIQQPLSCELKAIDLPAAVTAFCHVKRLILFTDEISITARLHQHVHRTGEVLKLRVIITNNSSVTVQSLKINLLRTIKLMCRQPEIRRARKDARVTPGEGEAAADRVSIIVEDKCHVGREQLINMTQFQTGLDCIQIPLKNEDGSPIVPSTRGLLVKCSYTVGINIELSTGSMVELEVPVSVILATKNLKWQQWSAPDWLAQDTVNIVNSASIFGVPDNVLHSEAFSGMPGFQVL